jgi:hypothetical protein
LVAVLSKETVMDVLILGIQIIEYNIGVAAVTSCKYNNFKVFAQILENFMSMGSNVDSCLDDFSSWEGNG